MVMFSECVPSGFSTLRGEIGIMWDILGMIFQYHIIPISPLTTHTMGRGAGLPLRWGEQPISSLIMAANRHRPHRKKGGVHSVLQSARVSGGKLVLYKVVVRGNRDIDQSVLIVNKSGRRLVGGTSSIAGPPTPVAQGDFRALPGAIARPTGRGPVGWGDPVQFRWSRLYRYAAGYRMPPLSSRWRSVSFRRCSSRSSGPSGGYPMQALPGSTLRSILLTKPISRRFLTKSSICQTPVGERRQNSIRISQ